MIVDVDVHDGLFSIVLGNIGTRPALAVSTRFDVPLHGLGGAKKISSLRVFRELAFMAPGKRFRQFVDELPAYAERQAPLRFTATVTYQDRDGRTYEESMVHDLRVYLELGQARRAPNSLESRP